MTKYLQFGRVTSGGWLITAREWQNMLVVSIIRWCNYLSYKEMCFDERCFNTDVLHSLHSDRMLQGSHRTEDRAAFPAGENGVAQSLDIWDWCTAQSLGRRDWCTTQSINKLMRSSITWQNGALLKHLTEEIGARLIHLTEEIGAQPSRWQRRLVVHKVKNVQ